MERKNVFGNESDAAGFFFHLKQDESVAISRFINMHLDKVNHRFNYS